MKITVIVCTYNRCQSLAKALASIAAQAIPAAWAWEVLVVDNNSKDQTRQVVEEFRCKHPGRFRYLFELQQGLSHARNAGVREAHGDILAFVDDDVIAEPTWLQNLTADLHDGEWAGSGGRVLPEQTFLPPRWLPIEGRYALAPLSIFDAGPNACHLTEPPFGANMAFHKKMFEKYGCFRTDLGRCAESMLSNEDTEFGRRLMAAGERLRYEPSAVVYHPVPMSRLQKSYFLTWWFAKGRSDIRQFGVPPDTKWHVAGIPLVFLRRSAVSLLRWMVAVEPSRRFSRKLTASKALGAVLECFRQRRDRNLPQSPRKHPAYLECLGGALSVRTRPREARDNRLP